MLCVILLIPLDGMIIYVESFGRIRRDFLNPIGWDLGNHIRSGAGMPKIQRPFFNVFRTASTSATLWAASGVPSRICTCAYQLLNALANSRREFVSRCGSLCGEEDST